jgi:hypothetical protein
MECVQPAVPKIKLKFVDREGMVRVRFQDKGGSSSLIGKGCLSASAGSFTMTFGWMDVATIIHEFGHALGMLHEHQNPAGGIKWNEEAVYAWAQQTQGWDQETTYENILKPYAANEISGSIFDPKSVMLYFFSGALTLNGVGTQRNMRMSETDLKYLASTYGSTYNPALLNGGEGAKGAEGAKSLLAKPLTWVIIGAIIVALIVLLMVLL